MHILFIGFGLIGGSLAKGIRKHHPDWRLCAYSRHPSQLLVAVTDGVLDEILDVLDERVRNADLIYLCTPVNYHPAYLSLLKPLIKESCLISDVGSTKQAIHEAVSLLGLQSHFIGGHPMAGSEKTGYEYATDYLFENAYYILTPDKGTTEEQLNLLKTIAKEQKAIPLVLDYKEHDRVVAAVSHLPHLVACALVEQVHFTDSPEQTMKMVAAGGFKDITRIASSSPEMWEQICLTNKSAISDALKLYISSLTQILQAVDNEDGNAIYQLFESAGGYRNQISDRHKGSISKQYILNCDIIDRPGSIAQVAIILAASNISMKNIGIVHNREFVGGVLRVEFYDQLSRDKAKEVFIQNQILLM